MRVLLLFQPIINGDNATVTQNTLIECTVKHKYMQQFKTRKNFILSARRGHEKISKQFTKQEKQQNSFGIIIVVHWCSVNK